MRKSLAVLLMEVIPCFFIYFSVALVFGESWMLLVWGVNR
uniref:Uncharacterized protein n=1 Tax=Anguilla anguilla TaxID=7936 RepID=A0A0E9SQM1_ANGAN